ELAQGAGHAPRGLLQALPARVLAQLGEDPEDVLLQAVGGGLGGSGLRRHSEVRYSSRVRTMAPVPPAGQQGSGPSAQAVPAKSKCTQGVFSTNSWRKRPPMMLPASPRTLPMFCRSEILPLIWSW